MKIITFVAMFVLLGCSFASERSKTLSSPLYTSTNVSVFDCNIKIPPGYQLITSERSAFRFSKIDQGVGSITIQLYDDSIELGGENIKIESKKIIEGLKIIFLNVSPGYKKDANKIVVIHNNDQAISIMGDNIKIWEDFIYQCSKSKELVEN